MHREADAGETNRTIDNRMVLETHTPRARKGCKSADVKTLKPKTYLSRTRLAGEK